MKSCRCLVFSCACPTVWDSLSLLQNTSKERGLSPPIRRSYQPTNSNQYHLFRITRKRVQHSKPPSALPESLYSSQRQKLPNRHSSHNNTVLLPLFPPPVISRRDWRRHTPSSVSPPRIPSRHTTSTSTSTSTSGDTDPRPSSSHLLIRGSISHMQSLTASIRAWIQIRIRRPGVKIMIHIKIRRDIRCTFRGLLV